MIRVTKPSEWRNCPYDCPERWMQRCPQHRPNQCGVKLECGADCCIDEPHFGPHYCCGDDDDNPGSCPA